MNAAVMLMDTAPSRVREPHLTGNAGIAHAALEVWARHAKGMGVQLGLPSMTWLACVIKYGAHGAAQRSGSQSVDWPEVVDVVERAMKHLREPECVVVRYEYLHWAAPEVSARHCKVSVGHYRVLLHRARRDIGMYVAASAVALQRE